MPKLANPSFRLGISVHEALEFAGKIWKEKEKFSSGDVKKILEVYRNSSIREGILEMEIHLKGLDLVKNRLNNFIFGERVVGLETKFGFSELEDLKTSLGVPLIGAIDRVDEVDEDTVIVVDYKTNVTIPTPEQLKTDVQLSIYDIVARTLWPQYKRVILCLDMLKSEPQFTYRTDAEREEFELYLKTVYDQMAAFTEKEASAELNIFCSWCDYKDYCPEYEKACKKSDYSFSTIADYDDASLVNEWKQVRNIKKILEERERTLSMVIMEKIRDTGSAINNDDELLYIRQNARAAYDSETVSKHVSYESYVKMSSLNKKLVDEYVDSNPSVKGPILKSAQTNYTSPFLATKKMKKVSSVDESEDE
jgi:hypothetical protein